MATAPWITRSQPFSSRPAPMRWPLFLKAVLPVIFFLGVFALESSAAFGSNHTSAPLHRLFSAVFGSAIDRNWSLLHHWIRKSGHFAGYGFFSLLCFRSLRLWYGGAESKILKNQVWAIAATFVVASADEIHQSFLPNRTGCFSDVVLDTCGAVAVQCVLLLSLRWLESRPVEPGAGLTEQVRSLPHAA